LLASLLAEALLKASSLSKESIDSVDQARQNGSSTALVVITWRTPSSGMLCRVALVTTDVSQELSDSIIRITRIVEIRTTLAVTSNRLTLRRNTKWLDC
jgi:hypothetical protein